MYDEFGNRENEDRYPTEGLEPEGESQYTEEEAAGEEQEEAVLDIQGEAYDDGMGQKRESADDTSQDDEYASASAGEAFAGEAAEESFEEKQPVQEEDSLYHYSYEKGEQREETNFQGQPNQETGYQHTQYYQNGEYHQRNINTQYQDASYRQVNPQKKRRDRKSGSLGMKFAVCAGLAVVFGLVAGITFQAVNLVGGRLVSVQETEARVELQKAGDTENNENNENNGNTVGTSDQPSVTGAVDISAVAENAMPSIVAITNKGVEEVQSLFFGTTQYQPTESSGSGVIIAKNDTELLIATNNHVVDGAQELSVCFTVETGNPEDAVVTAQVKGTDSDHDLAVVAVKLQDISADVLGKLKVAVMGDSDAIKVGTQVIAIGNALGYGQSVTVGYVSALNREVTIDNMSNNMIQTDAAINFGNSGGALLDTNGNLIGINSAKAADTGVEGMGYALPVNTASPILDELMNRTTRSKVADAEKGFLGIDPRDVSEEARQIYNLPAGAFVYSVVEGSPAEKAGIKKGDIITKMDGITISSRDELFSRMEYYKAGETIAVVVKTAEGGEYVERTVSVTLAKKSEYSTDSGSDGTQTIPDSENQDGQQPEQFYDGDGSDGGYKGFNGGSGGDSDGDYSYDGSLEDFFRQFGW